MIAAKNIGILLGLLFATCIILFVLLIAIRDTVHRFAQIQQEFPNLESAIKFFKVFMFIDLVSVPIFLFIFALNLM